MATRDTIYIYWSIPTLLYAFVFSSVSFTANASAARNNRQPHYRFGLEEIDDARSLNISIYLIKIWILFFLRPTILISTISHVFIFSKFRASFVARSQTSEWNFLENRRFAFPSPTASLQKPFNSNPLGQHHQIFYLLLALDLRFSRYVCIVGMIWRGISTTTRKQELWRWRKGPERGCHHGRMCKASEDRHKSAQRATK